MQIVTCSSLFDSDFVTAGWIVIKYFTDELNGSERDVASVNSPEGRQQRPGKFLAKIPSPPSPVVSPGKDLENPRKPVRERKP